MIRPAEADDINGLLAIENTVFPTDRLDRRGFRYSIGSPTIDVLVASDRGEPLGYVMVHRRRNSTIAHLTSVAVADTASGRGLGRLLVDAAESVARKHGDRRLRLEVRGDNKVAQHLYETAGYVRFETVPKYYEDGADAHRYEKLLA